MMFVRRKFFAVGLVALLAACAPPADDGVVDRAQQLPFDVTEVTIDTSAVTQEMLGDALSLSDLEADLRGRIAPKLAARSTEGGDEIMVNVQVTEVKLISLIAGAVPGLKSRIDGTVTTTSVGAQAVDGRSGRVRVPGVLGIVTAPDRATDYNETANGFATAIADAVFLRPDQN
ncbi:hypothetical protein N9L47_06245 [Rhodobacteraceae bacterium]|nr:hypothetical protein [Paracoccaceae bacterium]